MLDAARGFLNYHEDPAGTPSLVPLCSSRSSDWKAEQGLLAQGEGLRCLVTCKHEHPHGGSPEFRALQERAVKANLLEEASSCQLKAGGAGRGREGRQPRERGRGERGKWIL